MCTHEFCIRYTPSTEINNDVCSSICRLTQEVEYLSPITEWGKENSFDASVMAVIVRLWAEKRGEANVI
jgi:hypothetical protein